MVSIEYEMKLEQFENEIKDIKTMDKKLNILFSNEYNEILGDILNLKEDIFIDQVKEGVSLLLEDNYTDSCLSDDRLSKLLEEKITEIKNKYKHDYNLINKAWSTYDKNSKRRSNNESLLTGFRKHCINTDDRASHNCCSNEKDGERNCHFIIVNDSDPKKGIKFVVCENCKKVYYSSFILARCYKCKVDYYTSLLSSNENPELLLATWENYHCQTFINEKMKCIKCHEHFYINMKTGLLMCLNKKCEFVSKPKRILWQCSVCKSDFISGAIPYNPLDAEVTRRLISQTILLKHKAHPKKMPCCKLNVFFTDFYHKHNCNGLLYESELDDNVIIVCEKCRSINFYDRFHWTCPKCGKKFIDKSNENSENNNSPKRVKSSKKEQKEKEIDDENKNKISDRKSDKKEKDIDEIKKISTPKPMQYISKRLGMKKEKDLKEFNLNENDNDNIIEEENNYGIKNEQDDEKKKNENKKMDSARKYRRFHFNSIHINEDDKDKNEEKEKEKEKEKKEENNNIEEENNDNNYRTTRSRTTYNKMEKKKDEGRRGFRRFRFEKDNEDKDKVIVEEKEKEKEKEKEPENISPRMQWRKRYKKEINQNKSEEKEEREREKEREKKEKEERDKKEKEENISGRGWFRRLAATGIIDKEKESTNKSSKKEKEETTENDEESDEDNKSIDNNDEDNNEIMKFGDDDSEDEEKEKEENPVDPDPLYMNYNFKRNKNKKKTRGMELKGDDDEEEGSNNEEKYKIKIKKKKVCLK